MVQGDYGALFDELRGKPKVGNDYGALFDELAGKAQPQQFAEGPYEEGFNVEFAPQADQYGLGFDQATELGRAQAGQERADLVNQATGAALTALRPAGLMNRGLALGTGLALGGFETATGAERGFLTDERLEKYRASQGPAPRNKLEQTIETIGAQLPKMALGTVSLPATGVLGMLELGQANYLDTLEATGDKDQAEKVFWASSPLGLSEMLLPGLSRLPAMKPILGRLGQIMARAQSSGKLGRAGLGALTEGLQEGGETFASNVIADHMTTEDRDWLQGVVENTEMGGYVGGVLNLIFPALTKRVKGGTQPPGPLGTETDAPPPSSPTVGSDIQSGQATTELEASLENTAIQRERKLKGSEDAYNSTFEKTEDPVYEAAVEREMAKGIGFKAADKIAREESSEAFRQADIERARKEGALFPEELTSIPEIQAPKEKGGGAKAILPETPQTAPVFDDPEFTAIYETELAKGDGHKAALDRALAQADETLVPKRVREDLLKRGSLYPEIEAQDTIADQAENPVKAPDKLTNTFEVLDEDGNPTGETRTERVLADSPIARVQRAAPIVDPKAPFAAYRVSKVGKKKSMSAFLDSTITPEDVGAESVQAFPPPLKTLLGHFKNPKEAKLPPKTKVPSVKSKHPTMELLDGWLGDRQLADQAYEIDASNKEKTLSNLLSSDGFKGKKAVQQEIAAAMHLYIDTKDNFDAEYAKFGEKLTPRQQRIVKRMQSLSPELKAFADQIAEENKAFGEFSKDKGVIENVRENYTARLWKPDAKGPKAAKHGSFTQSTGRARRRTLSSILEGWAEGKELAVESVINAQLLARQQVAQVIHDRNLIEVGKKSGMFTDKPEEGYAQVEHPNFQHWKYSGKGENLDTFGKGVFGTEDGAILERVPLYAPEKLAERLNNILGKSRLKAETITKYNALAKQTLLFTSLFHHQAFIRSFTGGTPGFFSNKTYNIPKHYKQGMKAIEEFTPELQGLVHAGLTLGKIQDFDEMAVQQDNIINDTINKVPMAKGIKDKIVAFRDQQTDFLFKKMGPALKAQAALLEYQHLVEKNKGALAEGKITSSDIAETVASIVNDDFGGLNLQKMGRDPTRQHIFRLLALAPDWTESNVRSMVKAFKGGFEGKVYRNMWARVFARFGAATVLFNMMMANWPGSDDEERMSPTERFVSRYKKAWDTGKLRWLAVDISPIYRATGGEDGTRKYFSVLGHFKDPIKFAFNPIRSAKHKSSPLASMVAEAAFGTDWAGRRFTTFAELLGMDEKGDKKGETVTWDFGSEPLKPSQFPSYVISQAKGVMPIQAQNAAALLAGEMDWFSAITTGLGLMVSTEKEKDQ